MNDTGAGEALSDAEVVARIVGGETALFELVMRRHNQRLFRAARAIVRSQLEAEDVVQAGYVRAFEKLASFRGEAQLSTWLTRIVVNEGLSRLDRDRRRIAFEEIDLPAGEAPSVEAVASARELVAAVEASVDGLPLGCRAAFMLREVQGLSSEEAAACLDISEQALKVRLHRARVLLKSLVEARVGEAFGFLGEACDRIVVQVWRRLGLPTLAVA